jgi:hypothetical protein
MKVPIAFRVFAAINLFAFLLLLLQAIILITNPRLGSTAASISMVATAWLLITSFMWFFGSRYSYPLLYLTAVVIMATVAIVFFQNDRQGPSGSSEILFAVLYLAVPLIYSTFLIVSLFFKPVKEWATSVHTSRTHLVPAIILLTISLLSFGSLSLLNQLASKGVVLESVYASETLPSGGFIIDFGDLMEFDQIVISTDHDTSDLDLLIYFSDNYEATEKENFSKYETLSFKPLSTIEIQDYSDLPSVDDQTIFLAASLPITKAKRIMVVPITGSLKVGKTFNFSVLHRVQYFDKDKSPGRFITSDGIDKPSPFGDFEEFDDAPPDGSFGVAPEEIIENRDLPEPKSITPEERERLIKDFVAQLVKDYDDVKYIFNRDVPRMKVESKDFGFYAGYQRIFRDQSELPLSYLLETKNVGNSGELSLNDKIWELSGRGLYTNLEDFDLPFNGLNPNFVRWAKGYLLPQPNDEIIGIAASSYYNNLFRRSVWLLAVSREYFNDKKFYESEAKAYREAMDETGFYGPNYLDKRYIGIETSAPIFGKLYTKFPEQENEFFYFTEQVAAGFWLRRKLDNSEPEVWEFIKAVLNTYDSYPFEN